MLSKGQDKNKQSEHDDNNNQAVSSAGTSGEGGNGRLSLFKNHSTHGEDIPNEFLSSEDRT